MGLGEGDHEYLRDYCGAIIQVVAISFRISEVENLTT